jgi:hypothetical protein
MLNRTQQVALPHPDEPIPTYLSPHLLNTIHIALNSEIAYSILRSFKNGSIKLILNNQQAFFSEPVEITSRIAHHGRKNHSSLHE